MIAKRPIAWYWWSFWMLLLVAGLFVFYVLLTPVWVSIRLIEWFAHRRDAGDVERGMAMFHVVIHRSGPEYDLSRPLEAQSGWQAHADFMDVLADSGFIVLGGPLVDEFRVVHAVEAESEEAVRATLARDPWSGSHLVVDAVEPWTIRLDGRTR